MNFNFNVNKIQENLLKPKTWSIDWSLIEKSTFGPFS